PLLTAPTPRRRHRRRRRHRTSRRSLRTSASPSASPWIARPWPRRSCSATPKRRCSTARAPPLPTRPPASSSPAAPWHPCESSLPPVRFFRALHRLDAVVRPSVTSSAQQLISDRQATDSLAGRREDRVAQRGSERRYAGRRDVH